MKDFLELVARRESCRQYDNRPVEREKLLRCLEAARLAPSACNSQPWHFRVVTAPALRAQVAEATQLEGINGFTDGVPAFIVVTEEYAKLSQRILAKCDSQTYAQIDLGIAAAHICLAATEQGLSSCIVGWMDEQKLHELLQIPQSTPIRLILCIGYAASDALRAKKRKDIAEITTFLD